MKPIATIITCKGRLHHLRETLPLIVAQGTAETIVVDYDCPDRAGDWVEANFPNVKVVRVTDAPGFWPAHARNIGAAHAAADWLAFVDADVKLHEGWNGWLQDHLQTGHFYRRSLIEGKHDPETYGTFLCTRADFEAVHGFDEVHRGWGGEDEDLYQRLILLGIVEAAYPVELATAIPHGDEQRAGWSGLQNRGQAMDLSTCYRLAKLETLKRLELKGELPLEVRQQFMENTRRELAHWFDSGRLTDLSVHYELNTQDIKIWFTIQLRAAKGQALSI